MIRSMTGYGAGQASHENVLVKVELRSVNHRHLDAQIRIPRDLAGFEARIKERLGGSISRGRVSASIDIETEGSDTSLTLDESVADQYGEVLKALEARFGVSTTVDASAFLSLPDLVKRETAELHAEALEKAIDDALAAALDQLVSMRCKEGEALAKDLVGRIARIEDHLVAIEEASAGEAERVKERLTARIAVLMPEGAAPDPDRLATELAVLADKADIVEELVRFRAHDHAFLDFLKKEEPVGKRLDFLLQEMNREVNTIGSKSLSAEIAHRVVDVKEEIERLREQVQNIE